MDDHSQQRPGAFRRFFTLVALLALLIAGFALWLNHTKGDWVDYSDGSRARLLEAHGGAHGSPPMLARPWSTIGQKLPAGRAFDSLRQRVGGSPNGQSRSWTHVPVDSDGLHFWFEMEDSPMLANGGNIRDMVGAICDQEGWAWLSHGQAASSTVVFGQARGLFGLDFAGFPRWQREVDLVILQETWASTGQVATVLGRHRLTNPVFQTAPRTNWMTAPLPQTVRQDALEVVLQSVRFQKIWRQEEKEKHYGGPPAPVPNLRYSTVELEGETRHSNWWHQVQTSYFDNFGNNSHEGLPPRRPGNTALPPIQWRIALKLVGDHRSRMASNAFASIDLGPFPGSGEYRVVPASETLGTFALTNLTLFGPGGVRFVDGVLETNTPPNGREGSGVSESVGSSSSGGGVVTEYVELNSASPFLVGSITGSTEGLWFSCRAGNAAGDTRWLQTYGTPIEEPSFIRVFNQRGKLWFSCQNLATNESWTFTVGVHQPREVEFFVDRPEYAPAQ